MSDLLTSLLRDHTCLYASFDDGPDADVSRGDGRATLNPDVVRHVVDAGRCGGGLVFDAKHHGWAEDEFTFPARDNFPYCESCFAGTISMWLRGDPDADLNDKFPVDPFHVSRHAADGSFYLDLTRPNDLRYGSPRKLRFGIYGDSPAQDMFVGGQLLVVGELGWNDGNWHHIVGTWQNANSGQDNGTAAVYIDGVRRATMEGYRHQLTWDIDALTIGLGQRYAGAIDELLILDASLAEDCIRQLSERDTSLRNDLQHDD